MANSYSGDARWLVLYSFESGAIAVDDIGSYDLTNNGAVVDTGDYKEGAGSAEFVNSESDYLVITDASLPSTFPFKSGGSEDCVCFGVWFKTTTVSAGDYGIFGKYSLNSKRSFLISRNGATLRFNRGYNSGAGGTSINLYTLLTGRWYHLGGWYDAGSLNGYLRLWDDTAGAVVDEWSLLFTTSPGTVNLAGPLSVGCFYDATDNPTGYWDGNIDELVIGAGRVSPHEIDLIRQGNFDGSIDGLAFFQIDAEIEYREVPQVNVSQILVEVLYTPDDPNQKEYNGQIDITIAQSATYDQHFQYAGNITATINASAASYVYQPPGQYVYSGSIGISVAPSATTLRDFSKVGNIGISIVVGSSYSYPTKFYAGSIGFTVECAGIYNVPITGWDPDTGWGLIQLDWLDQAPPYFCPSSDIVVTIDPAASSYGLYAEYEHEVTGGWSIGGEGVFGIETPPSIPIEAEGGFKLGGKAIFKVVEPLTIPFVAQGGFKLGGKAIFKTFGEIGDIPVVTIVGRGGFIMGGAPPLVAGTPKTISYVGDRGYKLGGEFRYPEVVVVRPSELDETLISVVGDGGFALGGEAYITYCEPYTVVFQAGVAALKMGGVGGLTVIRPVIYEIIPDGGLAIGEEEIPDRCDAYALTGFQFEPSVYTGWNFNSFASQNGHDYGAAQDGIYLLEGQDDNGKRIRSGARVGPGNLGLDYKKRIRTVYCGKSGDETEVRVESEGVACWANERMGAFPIDVTVEGKVVTIDVGDFEELAQLEVVPLMVVR